MRNEEGRGSREWGIGNGEQGIMNNEKRKYGFFPK